MSNFDNISNSFYTQFSRDVYMLARQKASIYLPHVDLIFTDKKPGERQVIHRLGEIAATKVEDRYEELAANTLPATARSCVIDKYHAHVTLDDIDDMKMIFDPSGKYVEALSAALGKKIDEVIRTALTGSADNKTGSSSTAFDSNQVVDSSSAITLPKLVEVRKLFNNAFVMPNEDIAFFVEGVGYTDIMGLDQVIRIDYNANKPLVEGSLGRYLGMNFMYDVNMPLYTTNTNQGIAFTKKGLAVALPQNIQISIDRIPERRNAILIQASFVMGAVRVEENQVVIIKHT
jgi:hypothetical protein